jgi:hypothetical protein
MRRVYTLLATAAVALGLAVAVQAPAQAAWSDCPSMYVCLFDNGDGGGPPLNVVYRSPGTCYNLTSNNDRADAVFNDLGNGHGVQVYRDAGCTGGVLKTADYGSDPIPALHHSWFYALSDRNKASSIFFNNG